MAYTNLASWAAPRVILLFPLILLFAGVGWIADKFRGKAK